MTNKISSKKGNYVLPNGDLLLGNPKYLAFSYGGYRETSREIVPTINELKNDLKILSAMGVKLLRTYNTQKFGETAVLLEAIREIKKENPDFEMYIMLGTWIECKDAWTENPDHDKGNEASNKAEILKAVEMINKYPDIIKIVAVGNEAMVHWATQYYVHPRVILKWVNYLQEVKKEGKIPQDTLVTSSDNYESWGGGCNTYYNDDLTELLEVVDYVSLHTYPFHDSGHHPIYWLIPENEQELDDIEKVNNAMQRAKNYAVMQYNDTKKYMNSLGIDKPIHIGEIGWATVSSDAYGENGSCAADEYKGKIFYDDIREWTNSEGISCFYFEIFDEKWKDSGNQQGSENHFGLIKLNGEAKYALWDLVDSGVFDGLTRNGFKITKTYNGDLETLKSEVLPPPWNA